MRATVGVGRTSYEPGGASDEHTVIAEGRPGRDQRSFAQKATVAVACTAQDDGPISDLAQIAPGVTALVTPVGSANVYTGQVWQKAPVIDPVSRQGYARIALAYAPDLPPGGFASAEIKSGTVVAPMLPESAILSDAKSSYVYVVGKDNKVQRRDIKLGLVTDQGIAIVAGLAGDERVVLRAGGFLAPDEQIKPVAAKQ